MTNGNFNTGGIHLQSFTNYICKNNLVMHGNYYNQQFFMFLHCKVDEAYIISLTT